MLIFVLGEGTLSFSLLCVAFLYPLLVFKTSVYCGYWHLVFTCVSTVPNGHLSFSFVYGATAGLNIVCFPPTYCL